MKSLLEILREHFLDVEHLEKFYRFCVQGSSQTFGHISPLLRQKIIWNPDHWEICDIERTLTLRGTSCETRNTIILTTLALPENMVVLGINSLSEDTFAVYNHDKHVVMQIPRNAAPLFGVLCYGVQLVAYELCPSATTTLLTPDSRVWVSRRSILKNYCPGLLDVTASGALEAGESPLDGILRESLEEASLSDTVLHGRLYPSGVLSYVGRGGGEYGEGHVFALPEIDFCYHVGLAPGVAPVPMDGEVKYFALLTVSEILGRLRRSEFTPSATCVLLDFFIKRGILSFENEPDYIEIVTRLHRGLPYPTL
ncbi:hypothetical protein Z517_01865 [Fonsecaea pedrosoi CBS 271.37]|uniref:Nudix hydrolase domain-containing protein n=1 Tax=Fonsecaea pedrosoi CBS 271.37 TaxID=1442368 RepID=A0A0D2FIG2_9EURO|nr:uncharacterized protein Z517_01865 [Fonsecaea pedrosoi CBS 271.37]KIW86467.1 hypothetical protein Z517_01865 [Fonsecaea pedrosoi CBS 271.37]